MSKENVDDLGNFIETKECEISNEFLNAYELSNFIEGIIEATSQDICEEPLQLFLRSNNKTMYKRGKCFLELSSDKSEVRIYFIPPQAVKMLEFSILRKDEQWLIKDEKKDKEYSPLTTGEIDNLTMRFLNFAKSY
ncbi:hypothetical protein ACP3VS_18380 [Lysinibacillus sp. VIII_CA]|uniref:hypothetical protein n=1 Tax=Lysinibacillus sp. VIII_CA TaxID=3417452 RepID=UPI003CF06AAE